MQGGEYSEGFKYEESDILIEMFEVKCGNSEYTMFTEDEEFVPNLIYNMANFIVTSINFNYITKNQKTKTL